MAREFKAEAIAKRQPILQLQTLPRRSKAPRPQADGNIPREDEHAWAVLRRYEAGEMIGHRVAIVRD